MKTSELIPGNLYVLPATKGFIESNKKTIFCIVKEDVTPVFLADIPWVKQFYLSKTITFGPFLFLKKEICKSKTYQHTRWIFLDSTLGLIGVHGQDVRKLLQITNKEKSNVIQEENKEKKSTKKKKVS